MIMRVKPYYCPHCEQFRSWFQVKHGAYKTEHFYVYDGILCKYCNHLVLEIKPEYEKFIVHLYTKGEKREEWLEKLKEERSDNCGC